MAEQQHKEPDQAAGDVRVPEAERPRRIVAEVPNVVAMVIRLNPATDKSSSMSNLWDVFHSSFLASKGRRASAPAMSKEQLDNELDQYMANTKSSLDREMDEYMNGINSTV